MNYDKISVNYETIQAKYKTSTLISKVLAFNNCTDDEIKQLLEQKNELTINNSPCVVNAVNRILEAKENNERIFVGGDYDADGLCATSIMVDLLNKLGIENGYYIPNRFTEGYGLHPDIVQSAVEKGYKLIITVDNGVKAKSALSKAKELGIDVLVTDHHEYEELPDCKLFVHPKLMDNQFKGISGAGVALQLSRALIGENTKHLVLACVATIGDVMSLRDENRLIVRLGLQSINEHSVPQIDALFEKPMNAVNEKDLAFQIVPKLNAVGRLQEFANPNNVVRYFLTDNSNDIQQFAKQMIDLNNQRKQITLQMGVLAEKKIIDNPFLIIDDSRFHEGLVGLLAGKIASKYTKPTLVFCENEDIYKGSGRSIKGFDLHQFFANGFDEFITFGGHEQAIGCSIAKKDFEQFKDKVNDKFKDIKIETNTKERVCCIDSKDITTESFQQFLKLAPFGQGFPEVCFAIDGLTIKKSQLIKQRFLKVQFDNNLEGICFDAGCCNNHNLCSTVYATLTLNDYNGSKKCSLQIKSME